MCIESRAGDGRHPAPAIDRRLTENRWSVEYSTRTSFISSGRLASSSSCTEVQLMRPADQISSSARYAALAIGTEPRLRGDQHEQLSGNLRRPRARGEYRGLSQAGRAVRQRLARAWRH